MKKAYKKLAYGKDREGVITRYIRENKAWESHIKATKKFILEASQTMNSESAVIMGSGWWLDLPIDELSKKFNILYLIDISHPRQIVKKAERYKNVQLITADVTGVMEPAYHLIAKHKKKAYPELIKLIQNTAPCDDILPKPADFYVSLNLMSQLGVFLTDFIKRKLKFEEEMLHEITKEIQKAHLKALPKKKSCLVTDYKEICTERKTKKTITKNLIHTKLPTALQTKKWQWQFDLSGNYKNCSRTILEVIAVSF